MAAPTDARAPAPTRMKAVLLVYLSPLLLTTTRRGNKRVGDSILLRSLLVTAIASHLVFRLAYIFYIGLSIRAAQRRTKSDPAIRYARWLRFKKRTSLVFFGDMASTAAILALTAGSLPDYLPYEYALIVGIIFTIIGVAVKIAASRAIGVKGFYYYNFFCNEQDREYHARGIYRSLDNPMYGLGYLHAFGFPLIFCSSWGLVSAAFDWAIIWVFYLVFERPHTASHWLDVIRLDLSRSRTDEESNIVGQR